MRILGDREDLAFQLMESLDGGQQSTAIIYDEAPLDILTYNATKVSFPFKPQGLAAADMTGAQKETLLNLVALYVGQVRTDLAEQKLAAIREEGLDHFHLAWAGPVSKNDPHYYRIHGGNFVVEFDNRQGRRQPHPLGLARHRKRLRRRRPARTPAPVPHPVTGSVLNQYFPH